MPAGTGGKFIAKEKRMPSGREKMGSRRDLPAIYSICRFVFAIIAASDAADKYKKCDLQIKVADIQNG